MPEPTRGDALVRHHRAAFAAAGLPARPVEPIESPLALVTYEVRGVNSGESRRMPEDPSVEVQPHIVRLAVHLLSCFLVVLVGGLAMIGLAPHLLGYESVVVTSGSMEPTIKVADVVLTAKTDGQDLDTGSVINFEREDGAVLHRITEIVETGYRTTGDANRTADSEIVAPETIKGVGIVVVPLVGLPRTWVDQGQWLYLALTVAAITAAVHMSRVSWVNRGRIQRLSV